MIEISVEQLETFDLLPSPIWIFCQDSLQVLAANTAVCDWLGLDRETITGLSIVDIRPPDEQAALRKRIAAFLADARETAAYPDQWQLTTSAGAVHHASVHWRKVVHAGRPAVLATFTDLSREHLAEKRLQEREAEYAREARHPRLADAAFTRLFDAAPGRMIVLETGTHAIVAGTAEFSKAVARTPSELAGQIFFDAFPPRPGTEGARDMERLRDSLRRVERTRTTDVLPVMRFAVADGEGAPRDRFWSVISAPVLDEGGQLDYIILRVLDVTEISDDLRDSIGTTGDGDRLTGLAHDLVMRADETEARLVRLASLEARLRAAEDLLGMGEWEFDLATKQNEWSDKIYELYGWPKDKPAPNREEYYELVLPEDRPRVAANALQFRDSGSDRYVFTHRIVRGDGAIRVMRGTGNLYRLGGRDKVIGVVQDVTEIIGLQDELKQSAELLDLAGEKVRLGGWRVDLESETLTWTDGTFRLHEIETGIEPALAEAIAFYVPEYREFVASAFWRCATDGQDFDEIFELLTAKGNRIWVRTIGTPVRDNDGRIIAVHGALQDITELRRVEQRLNEALFQRTNVLENISDAFYTLDGDWRFTYVNAQAERLLRRRRDELLGRVIWDEFPDTAGSAFQEKYEQVCADGESRRFTAYFAPLEMWLEVNASAVPDGLAVYFRDVTQERQRNEDLRLLGQAVENLNDMVLITDAATLDAPGGPKITFVNPAFERLTGYSREEVLGQTPRMFQGPETSRAELDRIRAALVVGEPVRSELINYRKDGEPYCLELMITPVRDDSGQITSFVSIQRDITGRKQAEQDRRISEERFRLVAALTSDAIWDLDLLTGKLWWSPGLTEIFGHAREPEKWTTAGWRDLVHPEDLERILKLEDDAMERGANSFTQEYRFRLGDGSWALVLDSGIIFRDDSGKPVRMLGSLANISEQRAAEERRQQAQRLEAVGQITGGVAHDFNNILTVILGNAELLLDHLSEDQQARLMADVTVRAAERGAELTDRLLAFARRKPLEPQVLALNDRLAASETLIRRTLPESIDIEIIRAAGLWRTEIDPGQLEVALLNLAVNARDAMPDGGKLTMETANSWLDDDYAASHVDVTPGQYVLLTVTDTGHGMTAETITRAFEPFFTTKEVGKGSGLGLSMVFGFVKQSGGHVKIYSEPGEGTAVKMYFPRVYAKAPEAEAPSNGSEAARGAEQILVVEDEELVRDSLCKQLRNLGYEVRAAANAREALRIIEQPVKIDLLLTDVIMPGGMHGGELAAAARELRPDLPVLFTSGYTENAIVHNGRLDPGIAFLGKPYRQKELASKVRAVLDAAQG